MGVSQARGMMGGEARLLSPGSTPANPQMAIAMQQMMAGQQLLASGIALAGYNPNAQNSAAHIVGVAGTQAGMAGAMGGALSYPTSSGGAIPNSYAANSYLGSPPAPGAHAGAAMGGYPRAVYGSMSAEQAYGMAAMGGPTGKHARTLCSRRAPPLPHPSFTPFAPAIGASGCLLSAHDRPALSIRLLSPLPRMRFTRPCARAADYGAMGTASDGGVGAYPALMGRGSAVIMAGGAAPAMMAAVNVPSRALQLSSVSPRLQYEEVFEAVGAFGPIESVKIVPAKGQVPSQLSLPL